MKFTEVQLREYFIMEKAFKPTEPKEQTCFLPDAIESFSFGTLRQFKHFAETQMLQKTFESGFFWATSD